MLKGNRPEEAAAISAAAQQDVNTRRQLYEYLAARPTPAPGNGSGGSQAGR